MKASIIFHMPLCLLFLASQGSLIYYRQLEQYEASILAVLGISWWQWHFLSKVFCFITTWMGEMRWIHMPIVSYIRYALQRRWFCFLKLFGWIQEFWVLLDAFLSFYKEHGSIKSPLCYTVRENGPQNRKQQQCLFQLHSHGIVWCCWLFCALPWQLAGGASEVGEIVPATVRQFQWNICLWMKRLNRNIRKKRVNNRWWWISKIYIGIVPPRVGTGLMPGEGQCFGESKFKISQVKRHRVSKGVPVLLFLVKFQGAEVKNFEKLIVDPCHVRWIFSSFCMHSWGKIVQDA